MNFGELFSASWTELKFKFKVNSRIVFYFMFIPGLIALVLTSLSFYTQNNLFDYLSLAVQIIAIFTGILASTSLIYSTIFDKKDYDSSVSGGKKFYWRFIGLMLVQIIFLILLLFALIIPAIIFAVYWSLAEFVFIKENKGIIESLRGSFRLIRNNWWKVVGYGILIGIISLGISVLFSIPSWPTNMMIFIDAIKNPTLYLDGAPATNLSTINEAITGFFSLLSQLIIVPLSIIFSKYLYFALQKKKK
ncbi:MAG: hypothetical protein AABX17_00040 [Nanoarchaeota archaeon]